MVTQYGFYINTDLCTSCKCCVAACKDKNDSPVGTKYRRVVDYAGGDWAVDSSGVCSANGVFVYSLSYSCMHCADPACVRVCPAAAMTKRDDGIVYVNQNRCLGCGCCALACPYNAPRMNPVRNVMGKCDFCMDFIDRGENPACVDACQMRCLEFGDISTLRGKYGTNAEAAPLSSPDYTNPSVVIKSNRLATGGGSVINPKEELL